MGAEDHLAKYAEGWSKGDANLILAAAHDNYVLDDPNVGQIAKEDFDGYLQQLKEIVAEVRGNGVERPFMELSDVATRQDAGTLTAWCWWAIPGTALEGSGLIKVDERGVTHERLAYYTELLG